MTKNGGQKWQSQKSGVDVPLLDVSFSDEKNGWVAGVDGIVLRTTNGGQLWRLQNTPDQRTWRSIVAVSQSEVWIAGEDGMLLHSRQAGDNWQVKEPNSANHLMNLCVQKRWVWACGANGTIQRLPR